MATPTVSQAEVWQPSTLRDQATDWRRQGEVVNDQLDSFSRTVDGTRDHWSGDSANVGRSTAEDIGTYGKLVANALIAASDAAQSAAGAIEGAKSVVLAAVNAARGEQFTVADDGSVSVSPALVMTAIATLGENALAGIAALQVKADQHSQAIKSALQALGGADEQASGNIKAAFADIDGKAQSPPDPWPGRAVTGATAGVGEASKRTMEDLFPTGKHAAVSGTEGERLLAKGALKGAARFSMVGGFVTDGYDGYSDWKDGTSSGGEAVTGVAGAVGGGALGGAMAGAAVGAFAGPVGAGVGAGVGAIIGSELGKKAAQGLWHAFGGD